jgi:putative flippase GtrA
MTIVTTLREMIRYGLKGGSTLLANVSLMSVLVEIVGLPPEIAAILSTTAMTVVGYLLMYHWVFPSSDPDSHLKRGVTYYLLIFTGKAVNYVLFLALLAVVPYPVAWIGGAGIVFLGLFTANRRLFKEGVAA